MTTAQANHSIYKEDKDKQSQNSSKKTINKKFNTNGLGSEVHNANGASNNSTDNDDDYDEILYGYEFQMTDDQKKAAGELQNLKLDLGFTEDEPGPFYDVSERLRQLNEELAQEQIPEVEARNRKIQFKENLVDFVAPTPDPDMEYEPETSRPDELHDNHSDSDSGESVEHKSEPKKNSFTDEQKDVEKSSLKSDEHDRSSEVSSEKGKIGGDNELGNASSKKQVSQHDTDDDERVMLERNGKFEFIAIKDLTPEEREIYNIGPSSVSQPADVSKSAPDSSRSSSVKKPERKPSVASSVSPSDSSGSSRSASSSSKGTKVTSARGNSSSDSQKVPTSARLNSQSSSQKKQQSSSMSNMEKYEQKRKEDEEKRRKKEESDRQFQAWLKKKKEEEKKEKEDKKENKDDKEEQKKKDDEAFKKWKAKKEQQMQSEKKLKEQEAKYYETHYWQTHSETDCEKSYKEWLKEKQKKAKEKEEEERQKMKTFRQVARRSRNSANDGSIGGPGSSTYIDYYGYRY